VDAALQFPLAIAVHVSAFPAKEIQIKIRLQINNFAQLTGFFLS
jgi:hypothetical protein